MKCENYSSDTQFPTRVSMVLFFLQRCKRYFAASVCFVCLLVLFELINPKVIGYTVDYIIGNEENIPQFLLDFVERIGGRGYALSHLWIFSLIVIGIAFFGALFRYLFRLFNSMGAEHLVKRMRDCLYAHIVHLPYAWQDVNRTGDIIQRCTSDVDMIKNFISEQMTNLIRMLIMITLALVFMSRIHGALTLVAALFIPIVVAYSMMFHKKIGESFEKVDAEEGRLSAIAQENLTGVRVVRAFGREKYERDRFEKKNESYTNFWVYLMRLLASFWVTNDLICGIQMLTVISFGAYFAVKGELSAGDYVAFISYNGLLAFPVRQLGRVVSEMSKAGISIDRIRYIMNARAEADKPDAAEFPENGDIVFSHVSFCYEMEGREPGETVKSEGVLDDVSLTIKHGQTVGILGGTGSGKSTLVHLLDGLYELPEENGTITISGVDIRDMKKSSLRQHIGMVLQEPYLFSRSLEENIKIARDDATHTDVEAVVETASLSHAIRKFRDGYETYVGERGVTLSGGQKQRTAIAQMLIRKPDIMIFDDSLSAVDAQTDARIRQGLKQAGRDATVILISHRITTLMQADCIFVLEDGKVIERGTHEELVALGGNYKRIFELQSAQREEA